MFLHWLTATLYGYKLFMKRFCWLQTLRHGLFNIQYNMITFYDNLVSFANASHT